VIEYSTIVATPLESWDRLDVALEELGTYDWLIFTSQTAVTFVLARLQGRFPADMRPKIAAVGMKTARAVEAGGGRVVLVPADNRQEGLVQALSNLPSGTRVLVPIAAGGRTLLSDKLSAQGCFVDLVTAYETRPRSDLPPPPSFDVAIFASPSALRAFVVGLGQAPSQELLADKTVAVIGRTTAKAAAAYGLAAVVAESPSVQHLIRAIADARPAKGDR